MFDMRRREFLTLLGGAAAFPFAVRAAGKRLRLALPETITFLCPNMGVSVECSFADTEDSDEIYERVTCLACRQLHMLNLRTGKILGVRQSPIGASVTSSLQTSQLSPECEVAHTPLKKCRAGLAWVRGDRQGIGDGSRRRTRHL